MRARTRLDNTYSAANCISSISVVVCALVVLALATAEIVTDDLDVEIERRIACGMVRNDREPTYAVYGTDTEVDRSLVTLVCTRSPSASILDRDTRRVDIVLSRGQFTLMHVVGVFVRAGQRARAASRSVHRDRLRFGTLEKSSISCCDVKICRYELTRIIGTANGNVRAKLILDVDIASTLDTKLLERRIGQVEFPTRTGESTNGFAFCTLCRGPLGLLVTSRASVRAHRTICAFSPRVNSFYMSDEAARDSNVLDPSPATKF